MPKNPKLLITSTVILHHTVDIVESIKDDLEHVETVEYERLQGLSDVTKNSTYGREVDRKVREIGEALDTIADIKKKLKGLIKEKA